MPVRCSAPQRDLVDRISQAVANSDPVTVELLLLALEEVADERMLARLEAAMGRLGLPGQRRAQ